MRHALFSAVLALVLTACGAAAQPGTGVQGTVQVGPTCPVERLNSPCPPRPMAATVVVTDGSGREVARGQAGADGHFRIDVAPGTYTLQGLTIGTSGMPRPIPMTITVVAGQYTNATVQYDSGIR